MPAVGKRWKVGSPVIKRKPNQELQVIRQLPVSLCCAEVLSMCNLFLYGILT